MPNPKQLELAEGMRRDLAIQQGVDHANQVYPLWGPLALGYVTGFAVKAKAAKKPFTCEEVRRDAIQNGLKDSPDPRAWGAVIRMAAKIGLIRKVGMGHNQGRHMGYATLWEYADRDDEATDIR